MILFYMLYVAGLSLHAQQITIRGKVKNKENGENIPGATIVAKGQDRTIKVSADEKGDFILQVGTLPVSLQVTSVHFEGQHITVNSPDDLTVMLHPGTGLMEGLTVVAPNKKREEWLKVPFTVEPVSHREIYNRPTLEPYDLLRYKKGVDATVSSLTFTTPSSRGFNYSGSTRVNQIVDGMDNQAPGMNFFIGSFAGITDLDMESMEVLSGASSAFYGPGGMNGTILINSKSPFRHQGLSLSLKEGIMHVDERQRSRSPYHNFSLRWAKAFKNKVAFKVAAQYMSAQDWLAGDTTNYIGTGPGGKIGAGTRRTDPNYNGVNVYGDETSLDLRLFLASALPPEHPLMQTPLFVSRTGYHEREIIDPETRNVKLSGAIHYMLSPKIEAQLAGYWATGNTVYTGNNRYALKDIQIGQYKAELKHKNWFLRGYTTQEDAGEAYTATVTAQYLNEAWKPSFNPANAAGSWYPQYTRAFLTALANNVAVESAHNMARAFADQGRPVPGSAGYDQLFDQVRKTPISRGGGLFLEKSQLWMGEGQYDLSEEVKFAEIIIGGNYKRYILNSEGTLFIDKPGDPIGINEVGVYAQATKKLFNEALTLAFSGRMDKNEDFKEKFTPRASALVRLPGDNNLRVSYQSAYRFPSTQQKYILLDVGSYTILGGLPWVMDSMDAKKNPVVDMSNPAAPYQYRGLNPENMNSLEVGYRGVLADKKLLVDAYGYWGHWENFLGRNILFQPATGKVFSTVVNSSTKVKTHGFGLGLDYRLPRNFSLFFNGSSDVITDVPSGFQPFFNTPKYRFNTGVANSGLGKKELWSFNVLYRWQDAFYWDGELANGPVEAFGTMDAQVSYKINKLKSVVKLGGTNILNRYYKTGYANPGIGGVYYASIGINIF